MITAVVTNSCPCLFGKESELPTPNKTLKNGTFYVTVDTGCTYIYDEENKKWHKQKSGE